MVIRELTIRMAIEYVPSRIMILEGYMDYLKRPRFHAKRGLFAYEDTARNLDEFVRFYEVRFLSSFPDYTKWCADISKLSEKAKLVY
jgi:hypothetical protein